MCKDKKRWTGEELEELVAEVTEAYPGITDALNGLNALRHDGIITKKQHMIWASKIFGAYVNELDESKAEETKTYPWNE